MWDSVGSGARKPRIPGRKKPFPVSSSWPKSNDFLENSWYKTRFYGQIDRFRKSNEKKSAILRENIKIRNFTVTWDVDKDVDLRFM